MTQNAIVSHYGWEETPRITLLDLMEFVISEKPHPKPGFLLTPLLHLRCVGVDGFWSMVGRLSQADLGESCNREWRRRSARLKDCARIAGREISLREFIDMCVDAPVEGMDFAMPPLLRVYGLGKKGFWSVLKGLTDLDMGSRCNQEWQTRLVKVMIKHVPAWARWRTQCNASVAKSAELAAEGASATRSRQIP
jgi:hypothetical protein